MTAVIATLDRARVTVSTPRMRTFLPACFAVSTTLAALSYALPATAGDCPACTTAADCGGNFCVLWDTSPGCGMVTQICCPGQGCAIESGCPSCYIDGNCTIVDGPDTCGQATTSSTSVSGSAVASSAASTGASSGSGAGSTSASGASSGASTGSGSGDGGAGGGGSDEGDEDGCGCRVTGAQESAWAGGALVAGLALAFGRRARRASPERKRS